jgi:hypothetical protein
MIRDFRGDSKRLSYHVLSLRRDQLIDRVTRGTAFKQLGYSDR